MARRLTRLRARRDDSASAEQLVLPEEPSVPSGSPLLRRIRAMIAPVAEDRGAVIDDEELFDVAVAVYAAFGSANAAGGLTRAQIAAACPQVDPAALESRIDLFVGMGMLLQRFGKRFEQRFVFNLSSAAGIMVVQRLAQRGGVDELLTLLDRTRQELRDGRADRHTLQESLRSAQRMLTVCADYLLRLVDGGTIEQLIEERRHHEQASLMSDVRDLTRMVTERHPDLDPEAYTLVVEAQRYVAAREQFVGRLLDEGARAKDFSVLDPEEYRTAARTASPALLAVASSGLVSDPPTPWVDPSTVATAVDSFRPRRQLRQRPPRPAGPPPTDDPLQRVHEREEHRRDRQARTAELALDGAPVVDYTTALMFAGWPKAGELLVDLIAAGADPDMPYTVTMGDELLVEPGAALSYITPVEVRRRPAPPDPQAAGVAPAESGMVGHD